jgi:hypothetical protein
MTISDGHRVAAMQDTAMGDTAFLNVRACSVVCHH